MGSIGFSLPVGSSLRVPSFSYWTLTDTPPTCTPPPLCSSNPWPLPATQCVPHSSSWVQTWLPFQGHPLFQDTSSKVCSPQWALSFLNSPKTHHLYHITNTLFHTAVCKLCSGEPRDPVKGPQWMEGGNVAPDHYPDGYIFISYEVPFEVHYFFKKVWKLGWNTLVFLCI